MLKFKTDLFSTVLLLVNNTHYNNITTSITRLNSQYLSVNILKLNLKNLYLWLYVVVCNLMRPQKSLTKYNI